ncbi:MAG: GntR family transcriptional regulator [Pelolinea sp.]|nr:GntR family transcriptional regulator [Pelolinea sp.]
MKKKNYDKSLFYIDKNIGLPLYELIAQNLRDLILANVIISGDILPSESELSNYYQVNRLTVRQAINKLINEDLLISKQGLGTYRPFDQENGPKGRILGLSERMKKAGYDVSSRVLTNKIIKASFDLIKVMNLPHSHLLFYLSRVRIINGKPCKLETVHLPCDRFPGIEKKDFSNQSLYKVMEEEYGCLVITKEEFLEPIKLLKHETDLLGVKAGTVGMFQEGISYDISNNIVEHVRAYACGEYARFHFRTLERNYTFDTLISSK